MKLTSAIHIDISGRDQEGRRQEGVHTQSIRTDVVSGETVELGKFAAMTGTEVEEVLPTLPHYMQQIPNQYRAGQVFKREGTNIMTKHPGWQQTSRMQSDDWLGGRDRPG